MLMVKGCMSADTDTTKSTLKPVIVKIADFEYENDNFLVVTNKHNPDFTIYYTKEDINTGKGATYRYDPQARTFVLFNWRRDSTTDIKSVYQIFVNGQQMWAVSKIHKIAFSIDDTYSFYDMEEVGD
ncbi:hypothetical protein RF11_09235 [Thelohanellus kitauei]|uniref:Uncharacterized protein n=1 Tax=Thelohanellus kitauei TaxID=669202 RepID=A0A0C2MV51_THEKT|nr:hypothetical protein RF11_09235 [Thelohanellus kitauei]